MFVAVTRGRAGYTLEHDATKIDSPEKYWDFSYHDIGNEDILAMVNGIIAMRNSPDDGCSKVTIVTHSTGANAVLAAASEPSNKLDSKVGMILTIAPCLNIRLEDFWLPVRDLASIEAFYMAMS